MATKTYRTYSKKQTPQSEQASPLQVKNSAGGYSFALDEWKKLDRFLVLGSEGGAYYISEQKLTRDNAKNAEACIAKDGVRVVNRVVEISEAGRAPKNDPALFVLALAATVGNDETRRAAYAALPRCARIGTHLFHFIQFREQFGGWSRGLRNAVANWYESKEPAKLSYDVVKYQNRDGWGHRDLLRLAHPKPKDFAHGAIYHWAVKGELVSGAEEVPAILSAFEQAKTADTKTLCQLIREVNLPREAIPTEKLNEKAVWEALLEKMPYEAMTRNLATMTRVGLLDGNTAKATITIADRFADQEAIVKSRLHPLKILVALKTYSQGHGERGQNTWTPLRRIVDALDEAFYKSFGNVTPTGKRLLLALDISGSMDGSTIAGMSLTCREASAALALVTANVEKNYEVCGFATNFTPLKISPRQRLDDAVREVSRLPMGGTDCALPMMWALQHKKEFDAFCVYTDSETWAGSIHPHEALKQYRNKMGIPAKEIVVGMEANSLSIADPSDPGQLDIVGFDTATPNVISDFIAE